MCRHVTPGATVTTETESRDGADVCADACADVCAGSALISARVQQAAQDVTRVARPALQLGGEAGPHRDRRGCHLGFGLIRGERQAGTEAVGVHIARVKPAAFYRELVDDLAEIDWLAISGKGIFVLETDQFARRCRARSAKRGRERPRCCRALTRGWPPARQEGHRLQVLNVAMAVVDGGFG